MKLPIVKFSPSNVMGLQERNGHIKKGFAGFVIRLSVLFIFILLIRYLDPIFNIRESQGMMLVIVIVWLVMAVWVFLGGSHR